MTSATELYAGSFSLFSHMQHKLLLATAGFHRCLRIRWLLATLFTLLADFFGGPHAEGGKRFCRGYAVNLRWAVGITLPTLSAAGSLPISLFQMINYSAAYLPESLWEAEVAAGATKSENEQPSDLNLVTTGCNTRAMRSERGDVKRLGRWRWVMDWGRGEREGEWVSGW